MTRGLAVSVLLATVLAGCAPSGPARAPAQGLVPDGGGLQPNGTPLRIDFGRAESGVIPAVSRLLGEDPAFRGPVAGCALIAVRWNTGLTLWFDAGAFVGWSAIDPVGEGSAGRICAGA